MGFSERLLPFPEDEIHSVASVKIPRHFYPRFPLHPGTAGRKARIRALLYRVLQSTKRQNEAVHQIEANELRYSRGQPMDLLGQRHSVYKVETHAESDFYILGDPWN